MYSPTVRKRYKGEKARGNPFSSPRLSPAGVCVQTAASAARDRELESEGQGGCLPATPPPPSDPERRGEGGGRARRKRRKEKSRESEKRFVSTIEHELCTPPGTVGTIGELECIVFPDVSRSRTVGAWWS